MLQRKRELGIGLAALALFASADTDRITAAGHDARVTRAYPANGKGQEGRILRLDMAPTWR